MVGFLKSYSKKRMDGSLTDISCSNQLNLSLGPVDMDASQPVYRAGALCRARSRDIPNSNTQFDFCSYEQAGWPVKRELTGVLVRSR